MDTSSTFPSGPAAASIPMLSISTSSSSGSSTRTLPPLKIPDLDQDSATSSSSAAAVPFPRISQRRKLYRGIGTQPWHNKGSDSDSDSETRRAARPTALVPVLAPGTETMPNADPRRTCSESQITTPNLALLSAVYATPLIRKKSGEVVKSSLKSPSQSSLGSSGSFSPQVSMPPTPTLGKIVHFDGQLERVRLFHKEQKPTAVSREGSPVDTETSDNDALVHSEYRSSEDERLRSSLVVETVNIPLRHAMASTQERLGDLDIKLEQVVLSKDGRAVEGTVLVRNIAFEKWIAARFTFDRWQTTSEVTAKHLKSIPEENTDLFSFVIRLPEVTKKIEEKRLFFALRYVAGGREAWDNNRGENYQLRFKTEKKAQVQRVSPSVSQHPPSWPVKSANVDQMADLRKKLESVVREDEESSGLQSWDVLTAKLRAKNMHIEEDREAKKEVSLRSRYDFSVSSKVKWEPPKELPKYNGPPPATQAIPFPSLRPLHTKSASISGPPSQASSWRSPRGSPRDNSNDSTPNSPKFFIDPREAKHWRGPSPQQHMAPVNATRQRHHQRGGYFDSYMDGSSSAVLTPTTGEAQSEIDSMTPSTSTETVTPSVRVTEDNAEASSSETESTNSSTSSSGANDTSVMDNQGPEQAQARPARFNTYPMDNMHLSPPTSSGSNSPSMSASLVAPSQASWPLSPQGSLSSVGSTPSITSASSPSQSPSTPSELSDSLRSVHHLAPGANRPSLDSVDYSYFLTRFCYYTGHDNTDRHGLSTSYGSAHRRHSLSESTMDGDSPSWEGTESTSHRRHASAETTPRAGVSMQGEDESVTINDPTWVPSERPQFESPDLEGSWSGDSGHTTPTRSSTPRGGFTAISAEYGSPGKTTPRARSPKHADIDLEQTPRPQMEYFVRPYRGSL